MTHIQILTVAAALWLPAAAHADKKAATPEELVALLQAARKTDDTKAELSPRWASP